MAKSKGVKINVEKLVAHPFAEFLPAMQSAEFESLLDDILHNGQRRPILLYQGKILDGRNRWRAMLKLNRAAELRFEHFEGNDSQAIQVVYSEAIRRNMTDSQKAAAAVNFLPHFEKLARQRMELGGVEKVPPGQTGKSRDFAGNLFGVSGRYVQDAKLVKEKDEKLFGLILEGTIKVSVAKTQIVRAARLHQRKAAAKQARRVINPEDCEIITGDAPREIRRLPRRSIKLAFFDPPYNIKFKYFDDPTGDALSPAKYRDLTYSTINEAADALTPDGTLLWLVPWEHVVMSATAIAEAGLHIRNLIVWHESFGQNGKTNFGRTCRYIWYAVKDGDNFVFNGDSILIPSDRQTKYGDARAADGGKVPDALWDVARVCGTFHERIPDRGIPTQLPGALLERCIKCFTDVGDRVLDGFVGTGTTARAAIRLMRKFTGIERSPRYVRIAQRELAAVTVQAGKGD